jgi:uracil-DNA glycosylase
MLDDLLREVRACTICKDLPLGPNPIVQASSTARILIAGQAPGRITHHKNRPFDDPSGNNLRKWMGIDRDTFYDASKLAIIPMGFCYPGTGKGGDLPPRPECAPAWRKQLLAALPNMRLTLVIGQYAHAWHLPHDAHLSLTDRVRNWNNYAPSIIPLPHPSPRNGAWLKNNPWFSSEVLPHVQRLVDAALHD